jgi:hypothetical protein
LLDALEDLRVLQQAARALLGECIVDLLLLLLRSGELLREALAGGDLKRRESTARTNNTHGTSASSLALVAS